MSDKALSAAALVLSAASGGGSGAVQSVNGKTGTVTLYGTDINMSTDTSLPTVTEQISSNKTNIGELTTEMAGKQDVLTAGTNISINNNVISTSATPVSGTNDGTNWSTITIDGTTKAIPSGGSSSGAVRYDEAQSLTESQQNQAYSNLNLGCARTTSYKEVVKDAVRRSHYSTQQIQWNAQQSECSIDVSGLATETRKFKIEFDLSTDGEETWTTYTYSNLSIENYNPTFRFAPSDQSVIYRADVAYPLVTLTFINTNTKSVKNFTITSMTTSTTYTPMDVNLVPVSGTDNGTNWSTLTIGNNTKALGATINGIAVGTGTNALIFGTSNTTDGMQSKGTGSIAFGQMAGYDGNYIKATALGGIAGGKVAGSVSNGTRIQAGATQYDYNDWSFSGNGCLAFGSADSGGKILAPSNVASIHGAIALGYAYSSGTIEAKGDGSLACGMATNSTDNLIASGTGSQAFGKGIKALSNYQHAFGKYNVADSASTYALIIGNGTADDARSNALTVDWSGNVVCNNIPAPPSSDGTYNLQCSIVSGVITYSWVAA